MNSGLDLNHTNTESQDTRIMMIVMICCAHRSISQSARLGDVHDQFVLYSFDLALLLPPALYLERGIWQGMGAGEEEEGQKQE